MTDIPVAIWQLAQDEDGHDVVLLRADDGRMLPIVIGVCEAAAIWVMLSPEQAKPYIRRPWSHDLMLAMLQGLGARLERVVVDAYREGAFFATLHLQRQGEEMMIDARPSDAIALLLRASAPLYVNDDVLREEGLATGSETDEGDLPDFGEGFVE